MRQAPKPYRVIGAYDSETTNMEIDGIPKAFPILHQLGLLDGTDFSELNASNIEEHVHVEMYRHAFELYSRLDELVAVQSSYVPVILCHNLAFDMYGLSVWLSRHDVKVLAKSARKPITFAVLGEDGKPALVIWDTLIFSQQPLERMGKDCGYTKAVGKWDYDLIRTPETPLTDEEEEYAKRDIYTLLCWLAWWIKVNPDIKPEKLGVNVVTKTGIVRERRKARFSQLKGKRMKRTVDYYWLSRCNLDAPKTDDELFTMLACTRGGFTFCASTAASIPYNLVNTDKIIVAYDATSQHPAQLVSHMYPYRFREMPPEVLQLAFELVGEISFERILDMWEKPFPVAFYACYEFENLRPKKGSIFKRYGIFPLASARYKSPEQILQDEENGDKAAYASHMHEKTYCDTVEGANCAFGKVISAKRARFYLTELAAWEVWQAYEWDNVCAVHGYETGKFSRPNDIDVISVMQFYKAKNEFKEARKSYYKTGQIQNAQTLKDLGISAALVDEMQAGTISENDIEAQYLSLKADLNAIFGISASNSYKRPTVLEETGIEYVGEFGLCNAPKNPRVWYQFGQRIVGWSRIAQICTMYLIDEHVEQIINGDTDSIKAVTRKCNLMKIANKLALLGRAIDKGKERVCSRVRHAYPGMYDPLDEIGYYVKEFETDRFCASWNKAYCMMENGHYAFTIAGIPTKRRVNDSQCFIGVNGLADRMAGLGMPFEDISSLFLGYNVTYANDVIRANARKFPEWGEVFSESVTDYLGNTSYVAEPAAMALYPMSKTVNDTSSAENAVNMSYAITNNPNVNTGHKMIYSGGVIDFSEVF